MQDRPSQHETELGATDSGDAPARKQHLEIDRGDMLGRYVILDVIGRGGMGAVYAAYDPELDRKLAIKLILAPRRGHDEEDQQRLLREAQATAQLNHPNVITVHDVGTHQGRVFVAMEFVEGGTLREWIEAGPHPWRAVLERMIVAGRGLAAAHQVGLVHRDFKPANVLVGSDGRLRVADFGLARRVGSAGNEPTSSEPVLSSSTDERITGRHSTLASKLTMTGARVGTPAYMAPEQYEGLEVDARADQFGFCVALWEALYGERPFGGDNLPALMFAIEQGRVREPSRTARVPTWLRRVVLRGLARKPEARWPDMDALLAALARDRSRQSAVWSVIGALTLALAATIAAIVHEPPQDASEPCAGAEAAFADTYDEDDRRAITARFAEHGGAATSAVLVPALDRWADDWRTQWRDTCEATQVRAEQSVDMFDRRMACLERHRRRMHTLVGLLREADGELLLDALSSLGGVGSPSACERESLIGGVAPPSDPAQRAEVDRLAAELDEIGTLLAVGEPELAEARIAKLEPELAALGWAPLETELMWLRGDALGRRREFEASEKALTEAAERAIAIADDRLAIEALLAQASYGTDWEPRARESLRLLGVAEALVKRLGAAPALLSRVELIRARVHHLDGKWQPSLAAAERSLEYAEQAEPEPQLLTADAEHAVATALYRMGRHDDGLPHVDRAVSLWTKTLGANNGRLERAHNIKALYAMALGRHGDAIVSFSAHLSLVQARHGDDHLNVSDVLVNLGAAYQQADRASEAREMVERALAIREREVGRDNLYVGHTRANLANIYRDLGLLDEALAEAERAHAIVLAQRGPEHGEMIIMHHILADILASRGEHEQANEHLLVALELLRRPDQTNVPYEFETLVELSRCQTALGRPAQALEWLAVAKGLPGFEPDAEKQSDFDWAMAQVLVAEGDRDEARASIDLAIERLTTADETLYAKRLAEMRRWRDQTL